MTKISIWKRLSMVAVAGLVVAVAALAAGLMVMNPQSHRVNVSANTVELPPHDVIETPIYTAENKRVFKLKDPNLLIDEDGRLIINPVNGTVAIWDGAEQSVVDGANRKLQYVYNSVLDRHYVRDANGNTAISGWGLSTELFLIIHKPTNNMIYTTRKVQSRDWWDILKTQPIKYVYFDYFGREIPTKDIADVNWAASIANAVCGTLLTVAVMLALNCIPVVGHAAAIVFGLLVLGTTTVTGAFIVPVIDIKDRTTLADLGIALSFATIVPWQWLEWNGNPVTTIDGYMAYVHPETMQLVDFYRRPLYEIETAMPLILFQDDIITTNGTQAAISDYAVLINTVSLTSALNNGVFLCMDYINTAFGTFDCPVFFDEDGRKLMNGESADGITEGLPLWKPKPTPAQVWGGWWDKTWVAQIFAGADKLFHNLGSVLTVGLYIVGVIVVFLLGVWVVSKAAGVLWHR